MSEGGPRVGAVAVWGAVATGREETEVASKTTGATVDILAAEGRQVGRGQDSGMKRCMCKGQLCSVLTHE